jgi:hypothetical protein
LNDRDRISAERNGFIRDSLPRINGANSGRKLLGLMPRSTPTQS